VDLLKTDLIPKIPAVSHGKMKESHVKKPE
jgi:hypothetical protein